MRFRQLLPQAATVEPGELLAGLQQLEPEAERPYTIANFVASGDGRATLRGRSGGLGDDGDRAMFHELREHVDAVLVGTGTLRTERYGRILGRPERRERRAQRGLSPEPLACVITRSGAVPTDIPLFAEPEARIVLFTAADIELSRCSGQVELVRLDPGELTLTTAMRHLRADYGVRTLLCEGGPTLFGAMLGEGLVDELFLTLAPKLVGGGHAPAISAGTEFQEPATLRIVWLLERDGALYLRYRIE